MFERLKRLLRLSGSKEGPVNPTGFKDSDNLPIAVSSLFAGLPLNRFIDFESYLEAGSRKVWATWKACDLVAKTVMNTPRTVMRGTRPVEIPELEQLLTVPNIFETFPEMLYKLVMHCKLTGNAYILKDSGGVDYKKPTHLYTLNPKRVRIALNGIKTIKGYLYNANGQSIPIEPEEMIHIRLPHPNREWYGIGEIEAGEPLFNDRINTDAWQERFWANGANLNGILFCKQQIIDAKQFEEAKANFRKQYGGVENSGKIAMLTGDWDYKALGLTAHEMQSIEARKDSVESIFMMHGVPLSVAGIREAANFATADIDNQRFREYTVFPQVRLIQDRLTTQLVKDWGDQLELKFQVAGLVNVGKTIADYAPLFDRGGLTINEFREKAGLEPDPTNPTWEQTFMLSTYVPAELAGIQEPAPVAQQAQRTVNRFVEQALLENRNGEHTI